MKIKVQVKSVYGNELIYPICEIGKGLCELAGAKTFTEHNIRICKKLGYEFEVAVGQLVGI